MVTGGEEGKITNLQKKKKREGNAGLFWVFLFSLLTFTMILAGKGGRRVWMAWRGYVVLGWMGDWVDGRMAWMAWVDGRHGVGG